MIYDWSIIDSEFAKELFTNYICGSDFFKDKVIEIQNILTVFGQDQNRYFLDRYTDKRKYRDYDSGHQFLEKAGLGFVNEERPIANFITLSEVKKTTPSPLFKSGELLNAMKDDTIGSMMLSKTELKLFLEKMEEASNCLIKQDPQCQFLPITDLSVWDKMWKYVFMGEPMIFGKDSIPTPGYWFTKDSSGKLIKSKESNNTTERKYFRIRTLDLEDFYQEVEKVLAGNEISLSHDLDEKEVIIKTIL